jgi:hypothetical protein
VLAKCLTEYTLSDFSPVQTIAANLKSHYHMKKHLTIMRAVTCGTALATKPELPVPHYGV